MPVGTPRLPNPIFIILFTIYISNLKNTKIN